MTSEQPAPDAQQASGALAKVLEKNIHTVIHSREAAKGQRTTEERLADVITEFSGRMSFVYFHIVWFGAWIVVNQILGANAFDPFPFSFLTLVVSLEAIFLATFVLISQNRMATGADRRADLDLQIGLLTEHEVTRVLRMLDEIQDHLGIENDSDSELAELEKAVHPEDVLGEMNRIQQQVNQASRRKRKLM